MRLLDHAAEYFPAQVSCFESICLQGLLVLEEICSGPLKVLAFARLLQTTSPFC